MNFVGKILVVLIFVMSLVFMSFAMMVYATHKSWKDVVERRPEDVKGNEKVGLRIQLDNLKKENEDLQGQLEKLEAQRKEEIATKVQALAQLENQKKTLTDENKLLVKERDDLSKKEAEAVAALDATTQNLKELTEEVGGLRQDLRKAQEDRDKHFARVVKLTDDIHKVQQELDVVTERRDQLVSQLAHARELLAQYGKDLQSPLDPTPPALRGKVLAINDEKMVEISLGSDDGLAVSHSVDVFRGNKYIGRLIVVTTTSDKAVAKIDTRFTQTAVHVGDDVATKLRVSDQRAVAPRATN